MNPPLCTLRDPPPTPRSCSDLLSGSTFRLLVTGGITLNLLMVGGKCTMCVDLMGSLEGGRGGLCFRLYRIYEPRVSQGIAAQPPADLCVCQCVQVLVWCLYVFVCTAHFCRHLSHVWIQTGLLGEFSQLTGTSSQPGLCDYWGVIGEIDWEATLTDILLHAKLLI